jgi:hypothetical protein
MIQAVETSSELRVGPPTVKLHLPSPTAFTFATRLVQREIDLYKVQRLLGHKTTHMTQRYAHHSPESLREGVKILESPSRFGTILTQSTEEPRGEVCNPLL